MPQTRTPDRLGLYLTAACAVLLVILLYALAFGAPVGAPPGPILETVPEFPFKNTAQTGGVPGWVQLGTNEGTCHGKAMFMLIYANPAGQRIQIFSDAELKKILAAWYPSEPYQIPTHLWLGVINPVNGHITMGAPVPFNRETYPSPCVYWRGETDA